MWLAPELSTKVKLFIANSYYLLQVKCAYFFTAQVSCYLPHGPLNLQLGIPLFVSHGQCDGTHLPIAEHHYPSLPFDGQQIILPGGTQNDLLVIAMQQWNGKELNSQFLDHASNTLTTDITTPSTFAEQLQNGLTSKPDKNYGYWLLQLPKCSKHMQEPSNHTWSSPSHHPVSVFLRIWMSWPSCSGNWSELVASYGAMTVAISA